MCCTSCLVVELTHASFAQATNHLLRRVMTPIRECALMAGVLLPGDVGAAADEAVAEQLQAQKLLQQQIQQEQKQRQQQQQQGQRAAGGTNAAEGATVGKEGGEGGGVLPAAGSDEFWEALETSGGVAALKKQQQKARAGAKKRQKAGRKEREAFAQAAQQQAKAVASGEKKTKEARNKARSMPKDNAKGSDRMRPFPMGKAVDVVILVGGATRMPAVMCLPHVDALYLHLL